MPALRVCVSRNPEFAEAKSLPEVPEEARSSAKSALEQKVLKSMIWWKALGYNEGLGFCRFRV